MITQNKSKHNILLDFAKEQSIDRPTVLRVLEDSFRSLIRQTYKSDSNFEIISNVDTGEIQIWRYRDIIEDSEWNETMFDKISLSEARKIEPDFEVGEQVANEIDIETFGRRAIYAAKQTLFSTMVDIRQGALLKKYLEKKGEIVCYEAIQAYSKEVILSDDEGYSLVLPRHHQLFKDRFRKGNMVKAVIHEIEATGNRCRVILSRTSPDFLRALLESEIPEIKEGLIDIKNIVREPGERAKVTVRAFDDNIDPVGACVGVKGSRISGLVRELNNEHIDIINHTESVDLLIFRALSPAKVSSLKYLPDNRVAVYMRPDQVAKAVGVGGHNIRLASKLLGMEIDIYREADIDTPFHGNSNARQSELDEEFASGELVYSEDSKQDQ